jgi:hypothetical protein
MQGRKADSLVIGLQEETRKARREKRLPRPAGLLIGDHQEPKELDLRQPRYLGVRLWHQDLMFRLESGPENLRWPHRAPLATIYRHLGEDLD